MEQTTKNSTSAKTGQAKLSIVFLVILLSVTVVTPFFFMGKVANGRRWYEAASPLQQDSDRIETSRLQMPETHDMAVHFDQMRSFYTGLSAGELYPRWEEDTNRGFGAPTMNYYSPGIYYVTSAFYWLAGNWRISLWLTHLLMMIASALAFYLYARRLMPHLPATIAMTAYVLAPYHLIDQYQRGAIAELLIFVWMPLILFFADRLLGKDEAYIELQTNPDSIAGSAHQKGRRSVEQLWNIIGLAASYGAALWSHIPTAFQLTFVLAITLPLLALLQRNLKGLLRIAIAMIAGLGFASAYLYPAAVEQNLIHSDLLNGEIPYQFTYLFSQPSTSFQAFDEFAQLLNHLWLLNVVVIVFAAIFIFAFRASVENFEAVKARLYCSIVAGLLASFMMLSASDFLRRMVPKLEIGVFSWRLLSISTFVAALLVGLCAANIRKSVGESSLQRWLAMGFVCAVLLLSVGISLARVMLPMQSFQIFESRKEHLNKIMMPRNVKPVPRELPIIDQALLVKQQGRIAIDLWKPEQRKLSVTLTNDDQLVLRTFFFPGWTATVNGKPAMISIYGEVGAMQIDLPAGSHSIELNFRNTPARQIGKTIAWLFVASLLAMMAIAFLRAKRLAKSAVTKTVEPKAIIEETPK